MILPQPMSHHRDARTRRCDVRRHDKRKVAGALRVSRYFEIRGNRALNYQLQITNSRRPLHPQAARLPYCTLSVTKSPCAAPPATVAVTVTAAGGEYSPVPSIVPLAFPVTAQVTL